MVSENENMSLGSTDMGTSEFDFSSLIKQSYTLHEGQLSTIVRKVYGVPFAVEDYHVRADNYYGDNYLKFSNVDGIFNYRFLTYHMSKANATGSDDFKFGRLTTRDEIIEYWRNHSNDAELDAPMSYDYDDNGEQIWWQPELEWILNDLVKLGAIPSGNYTITFEKNTY